MLVFIFESLGLLQLFLLFQFSTYYKQLNIYNNFLIILDLLFFYFTLLISFDRDDELLIKFLFFNWLIYLFIFVIYSLVIFINEELDTSLSEIFFETFFFTFFLFFFPDFIIFFFMFFLIELSFLQISLFFFYSFYWDYK